MENAERFYIQRQIGEGLLLAIAKTVFLIAPQQALIQFWWA
jgi:hypothetical protein